RSVEPPQSPATSLDPASLSVHIQTKSYDAWCGVAHGCTRKLGMKICGFLQKNNSLEESARLTHAHGAARNAQSWERAETDFSNMFARDLLPAKNGEEPTLQFLLEVVEILTSYVRKTFDRSTKVLDFHHPHQLLE
uniref:Uncharacterized protein n=1 Tax=Tetraodon nigroviridis TaxID=99883 RepID=H3C9B0_TETNG